jgi:translocation and assembly module TamB
MLKFFYLALHYLMLLVVALFLILLFALYHPRFIEIVSEEFSHNELISFSKIEGSMATHLSIYDLNYKDQLFIKELRLNYNLLSLLFAKLRLDQIEVIAPVIHHELYDSNISSSDSELDLPDFSIAKVIISDGLIHDGMDYALSLTLTNLTYQEGKAKIQSLSQTRLHVKSTPEVKLWLDANTLSYDKALHVKHINSKVAVDDNVIKIQGAIQSNTLKGRAQLLYAPELIRDIEGIFTNLPKALELTIKAADFQKAEVSTHVDSLSLHDQNLSFNALHIDADYRYGEEFIRLHVNHDINETHAHAKAEHDLRIGFDGTLSDALLLSHLKAPIALPFDQIEGALDLNNSLMIFTADTPHIHNTVRSHDFETFALESRIEDMNLSFLELLPKALKTYPFSSNIDLTYQRSANLLNGSIVAHTDHTAYIATLEYNAKHFASDGMIYTDGNTSFWQSIPIKDIENLHLITDFSFETSMLFLNSEELYVTLFDDNKTIRGWGSLASSDFNLHGRYGNEETKIRIDSHIPSLFTAIDTLYDMNLSEGVIFDCEMELNTTLRIDDRLHVNTQIALPWYLAMSDKENIIYGTDARMSLSFGDDILSIDTYRFHQFGKDFFATNPSRIWLDDAQKIQIDPFWINDGITLKGYYDLNSAELLLDADAQKYHYKGEEGESDIDLHVRLSHDENGSNVEGNVALSNTLITYKPVSSGVIKDDDIILIQDVKAPKKSPLSLNVQLYSQKPIRYKTQQVDVTFTPDITVYKEPLKELELLGWVTTDRGRAFNGGSEYEIKKSEVYFDGGAVNPFLNLHLFYEIDTKEIDIYVTHTLSSPVLLFTSNPPMSQSDIISYLLFGTPANSSFDSDGEGNSNGINAANIFLGTGLKQMIGDTTGLHLETLNLLSKKDGGVGFEVGTRISRDVRIVLKNDDIFSMVLQMNLTRELRLDVDVEETGQGVNIIYVKDYRDFLKK